MILSFRENIYKPLSRSRGWVTFRSKIIHDHPYCEICGRTTNLQVHHKKDVSTYPELEFDEDNLVVLCNGATRCHFVFGHLGSWRSINYDIDNDIRIFKEKFKNRR